MNILIVDDEQEIVRLLTEWLSEQGHEVVGITGGAHAVSWVQKQGFNLVFLDIRMPDANGLALVSDVVKTGAKAIVMSGLPEEWWAPSAMQSGASACLPKPISFAKLQGILDRL